MAFSPAWGGLIPLVPIGSFRDFLGQRRQGKELRVWYIATLTRPVVSAALRTTAGKAFVRAVQMQVLARLGFKPTPTQVGVELQAYIAFMKFQQIQASKKGQKARQAQIERIMSPGKSPPRGRREITGVPEGYFREWPETQPREFPTPKKGKEEQDDDKDNFVNWFDRRKRRRGRFVNV